MELLLQQKLGNVRKRQAALCLVNALCGYRRPKLPPLSTSLLQRKVSSFVAIERSWLTITVWQGVVKLLVVAYLFLSQLLAGPWQGGVLWQGASSTSGVQGIIKFCSPSPQHHRLLVASELLTTFQGKSSKWGLSPFADVVLMWRPLSSCGCTASLQKLLWPVHGQKMYLEKFVFLRSAPEVLHNRLSQTAIHHFLLQVKKGYYSDLAIRAILKILGTVPVAAEDVYHTGRLDSPLAMNLMYKCGRQIKRYMHLWFSTVCLTFQCSFRVFV